MTVSKDDDFRMYFVLCTPMMFWLILAPYAFLELPAALLVSGLASTTVGAVLRWRYGMVRRRRADALRGRAEEQLERARWACMTNLTEADERWLAERHFWVVPVQVVRLRAGLDPQPEWRCLFEPPPDLRQLQEMQSRSESARAAFEGVKRTKESVQPVPVERAQACPAAA